MSHLLSAPHRIEHHVQGLGLSLQETLWPESRHSMALLADFSGRGGAAKRKKQDLWGEVISIFGPISCVFGRDGR